MKYNYVETGIFLERPNRFIAYVSLQDRQITCHVKNTGRCRELLIPGTKVIVEYHPNAKTLGRKTSYSLIGVYKQDGGTERLINMDSQAPNQVAYDWLAEQFPDAKLRREVKYNQSRFDLAFHLHGSTGFMEVKGVTLEEDGICRFPDAPTDRGIKHLHELCLARREGFQAYVLFVIQMASVKEFQPNCATHAAFGDALLHAYHNGVKILAYDCNVEQNSLVIQNAVSVNLLSEMVKPFIGMLDF